MNTQARSPFETSLHTAASQLVERAAALPTEAGRPQVLRWLLAIGALFIAWRMWRGLKSFLWALFGLAAVRSFLGG